MKKKLAAMNAHIGSQVLFHEPNYIFEPKLDGYRALCYVNKTIHFISRNNRELTDDYPSLHDIRPYVKADQAVLDGEIIALDDQGLPNFNALQVGKPAYFVVFDILMKDDKIFINEPLMERKKILKKTVVSKGHLMLIPYTDNGKLLWEEMMARNLEGVMAKEKNSLYQPGIRSWKWLKIKRERTIDCIIIGYTKQKRTVSSLACALYDAKKNLRYIGKVGTGYSEETIAQLHAQLKKLKKIDNPFPELTLRTIIWVEPKIVVEVKYLEFTPDGRLRTSVFKRLRPDKKPAECTIKEQARQ